MDIQELISRNNLDIWRYIRSDTGYPYLYIWQGTENAVYHPGYFDYIPNRNLLIA